MVFPTPTDNFKHRWPIELTRWYRLDSRHKPLPIKSEKLIGLLRSIRPAVSSLFVIIFAAPGTDLFGRSGSGSTHPIECSKFIAHRIANGIKTIDDILRHEGHISRWKAFNVRDRLKQIVCPLFIAQGRRALAGRAMCASPPNENSLSSS